MEDVGDPSKAGRLYEKGLNIRERRSIGLWLPIMWHLALRGHPDAMIELANWFSQNNSLKAFGSAGDRSARRRCTAAPIAKAKRALPSMWR